ncbi:SDR family oxidoreductase [Streptomyces carpaticus]|uniref:SDR family oxidoreductase n=1 Tax=Streptomyces carpaticus TaxID=285558 RepID=UPI0031F9FD62
MTVVMTGATGFLGVRLVGLMLEGGESVTALVRGGRAPAGERVAGALRALGAPAPLVAAARQRVRGVEVDLGRADLGLPGREFTALAQAADSIWHVAGHVGLAASQRSANSTNLTGTRHLLQFAAAAPAGTPVHHVSTAFVAGKRHTGAIAETDLDGSHGFVNFYEQSKYEAERHVHDWAARHRARVVIHRPSLLVTDRPPAAGAPGHTLLDMAAAYGRTLRNAAQPPAVVRLPGRPDCRQNMLPVDTAARMMLDAGTAADPEPGRPLTRHITHPEETPLQTLYDALGDHLGVRFVLTAPPVGEPSAAERRVLEAVAAFTPYGVHRRSYLRSAPAHSVPPVDRAYLLRGLGGPAQPRHP